MGADSKMVKELIKTLERNKEKFLKLRKTNEDLRKRIRNLVKMIKIDSRLSEIIKEIDEEIEDIKNPSGKYMYSYREGGMIPKPGVKTTDEAKKLEDINRKLKTIVRTLEKIAAA